MSAAVAISAAPGRALASTQPAEHVESAACDQRYPGSCSFVQKGAVTLERVTRKGTKTAARHRNADDLRRPAVRQDVGRPIRDDAPGRLINGIVAPLAEKIRQIQSACTAFVISGVRHTLVAGTRRMSLHAQGKAVDVRGDYGCIYAQLAGWPGGYSTDARRVRHIHISYDTQHRREWGIRFAHGHHGRSRVARNRHAALQQRAPEQAASVPNASWQ